MTQKELNLAYFEQKLPELLADVLTRHKYVVIVQQNLKGAYDAFDTALRFAVSGHSVDEFIIQHVVDPKEVVSFVS